MLEYDHRHYHHHHHRHVVYYFEVVSDLTFHDGLPCCNILCCFVHLDVVGTDGMYAERTLPVPGGLRRFVLCRACR